MEDPLITSLKYLAIQDFLQKYTKLGTLLSGTGHRPNKLGGYKDSPLQGWVRGRIQEELKKASPSLVITGMALGFDQWLAEEAMKLNIPFLAAVPFVGQENIWPESSRKIYEWILSKAAFTQYVSMGSYSNKKLQLRNQWMVDHSGVVLACYDGTSGGTQNCVNYAINNSKQIIYINPKEFKDHGQA